MGRLREKWWPIPHLHLREEYWPWPPSGCLGVVLALVSPKVKAEQDRRAQKRVSVRTHKASPSSPEIRLTVIGFSQFPMRLQKRWEGKGLACQSKRLHNGATNWPAGSGGEEPIMPL